MPTDAATYRPIKCYRCGETLRCYTFKDVWDMRIDNKMHQVPVLAVPCMRCDDCDIAITDGSSDDQIEWSYKKYINEKGLNTPWLRFRRWVRKQLTRAYYRWDYWVYKTFYKKDTHGNAH